MIVKNKFLIFLVILLSNLFCGTGEFTGWGDTILHHVADSNKVSFKTPISKQRD